MTETRKVWVLIFDDEEGFISSNVIGVYDSELLAEKAVKEIAKPYLDDGEELIIEHEEDGNIIVRNPSEPDFTWFWITEREMQITHGRYPMN